MVSTKELTEIQEMKKEHWEIIEERVDRHNRLRVAQDSYNGIRSKEKKLENKILEKLRAIKE